MKITETSLPGVLLLEPKVFGDERGFFFETFSAKRFEEAGIPVTFVQDNLSHSIKGTLRGLHFQEPTGQGKLVQAITGVVFDVAVDVRRGSPHFGQWCGVELSGQNKRQLWIPPGFAHGFCVLSERADFLYKCTAPYAPEDERSILWCDSALGIQWPLTQPLLSPKDTHAPTLAEAKVLPPYAHASSPHRAGAVSNVPPLQRPSIG